MIKLQIIGRIGKDAEVKQVNGRSVINFSVAHSEKWKDQSGEQKEKTTWVDVAKWGDKTSVAAFIKKGGQIYVEGTPEVRTFAKQDGTTGASLTINASNVQLLGGGTSNDAAQPQPAQSF